MLSIISVGTPLVILCLLTGSQSHSCSWERPWLGGCLGLYLMLVTMFGAPQWFSCYFLCPSSNQEIPQPVSGESGTHMPKS